jgi:hypothetical protein
MEKTGLLNRIVDGVANINEGRIALHTDGVEHEGRIAWEAGFFAVKKAFEEAGLLEDIKLILLAEYAFLGQEVEFCDATDTFAIASLHKAVQSFDDAFRVLPVVENAVEYSAVEKAFPCTEKYRISNMPNDCFHIACTAHRTRLNNIQRAPGINMTEKTMLRLRAANMLTAKKIYWEKQHKALIAHTNQPSSTGETDG